MTTGDRSDTSPGLQTRTAAALAPRYMLEREIGRGGMATVFLAADLKHRRRVAIKVLNPEVGAAIGADRFLREIEIAARLTHPHILALHDSGEVDGLLYYTMPFVEGESLRDHLRRKGRLTTGEAVALTKQVAEALAYAHDCQVIHRDIKPENILLSHGHALVADFGIARAVGGDSHARTQVGMSVGTPAYLSPEQALGETVDGRSDLYSLACMFHEMLSGAPPFEGQSAQAMIAKRFLGPPPSLRGAFPEVPEALEAVLLRALASDANDRYTTVAEFAVALTTAEGNWSPLGAVTQSAERIAIEALRAQVQLNRGTCFQSLGKAKEAEADLRAALTIAERLGDKALLARSHVALLFLHIFIGPPPTARRHGELALALAGEAGDKTVAWSAHTGLATLAGLTGDGDGMLRHMEKSEQIAEALQSPILRLYTDELAMQYAFACGKWDEGIALSESTIATARTLNQRNLLPRLLAWATHFYVARGEFERAKRYLDEAWEVGVARGARGRPIEIHSQVAVYAGLANYYLTTGDWAKALEIGEQGLEIADRAGYVVWATYRLLPVTAEAAMYLRDMPRVERFLERMRADSKRLGHLLGLVWVTAGEGLIARLREDWAQAAEHLRSAIDELEKVPWVHDAARLRRWLADALIHLGDREAGLLELRRSYDVCAALGAKVEVGHARLMMQQLGIRPPSRTVTSTKSGKARLTSREMDIARMVVARKSNKEIAAALGIAARTVTTHVANIFTKIGVSSRGELADRMRDAISAPPPRSNA
jgi:DNA-binding CsgD family transcriptional regulator/tetratricopeptide (TPR) repeat protein/tRNA A-37 threonylcarbamoyl transferase component Bud32